MQAEKVAVEADQVYLGKYRQIVIQKCGSFFGIYVFLDLYFCLFNIEKKN